MAWVRPWSPCHMPVANLLAVSKAACCLKNGRSLIMLWQCWCTAQRCTGHLFVPRVHLCLCKILPLSMQQHDKVCAPGADGLGSSGGRGNGGGPGSGASAGATDLHSRCAAVAAHALCRPPGATLLLGHCNTCSLTSMKFGMVSHQTLMYGNCMVRSLKANQLSSLCLSCWQSGHVKYESCITVLTMQLNIACIGGE